MIPDHPQPIEAPLACIQMEDTLAKSPPLCFYPCGVITQHLLFAYISKKILNKMKVKRKKKEEKNFQKNKIKKRKYKKTEVLNLACWPLYRAIYSYFFQVTCTISCDANTTSTMIYFLFSPVNLRSTHGDNQLRGG